MSWKDRLKRSIGGEGAESPRAPTAAPRALHAVPLADAGHAALVDELRQRLVVLSDGKLRADQIEAQGHLFDYGYIDSLSAVTFLALIEEEFGTRIEDVELVDQLSTLDAIVIRIRSSR